MINKDRIIEYAREYNTKDFIDKDPIRFPRMYNEIRDIEISGFISSWMAYGNRNVILNTLEKIHLEFRESPYNYIRDREFEKYYNSNKPLYRFYKEEDYYNLCNRFYKIYILDNYPSLEVNIIEIFPEINQNKLGLIQSILDIFLSIRGIPKDTSSACKRVSMFLRWMVRGDGIVDLGVWKSFSPKDLILPLDTHSYRISKELGLTNRNTADMKTALEITEKLEKIFPQDPSLGDFALFGYGVNNK